MILTCNSCQKKFVVPDKAIIASGRLVQCGSCGNKWKQFPVGKVKNTQPISRTQKNSFETSAGSTKNTKTEKSKKNYSEKNKRNQFVLTRISSKKTWYQNQ